MIRVVDYGVGNIQAFLTTFKRLGLQAARARSPAELDDASRLILPGVGAFDHAMLLLNRSGLRDALEQRVLGERVPILGVCVGMQMLAASSEEGQLSGLNWVQGRVRAFATLPQVQGLPLPHMGWNDVRTGLSCKMFAGFEGVPRFYFLHSYFFECEDRADVAGTAFYGMEIDVAVAKGNICGVQFHPEKSHHYGARMLKNFAES